MNRLPFAALSLLLTAVTGAHAEIAIEERSLSTPTRPAAAAASAAPATGAAPGGVAATSSNALWDQYQQLQQLQQQLGQLQGMVEQQGFLIEKLQNDLRVRYTDLDQRLTAQQEMQQQAGGAAAAMPADPAGAVPAGGGTATGTSVEEEKRAYLAAYDTFRAGGPDKAIPPMLAFVKRYPHSSFTPGAYYWLGEFYLNASTPDPDAAQKQFDMVLKEYPNSPKAAAALYKTAAILDLRGKTADARQKMLELKSKYPQSPEAGLADNYLQALEAASAPAPAPKSAAKPTAKAKTSSKVTKKN
jgi:tol-pal system protein YbgF